MQSFLVPALMKAIKKPPYLAVFLLLHCHTPVTSYTIKLEEKENLKNLYVTEQQIVRFAQFVLMLGKSIFRPTFDS